VLGEFYWKVEINETVWAEDYEHGREIVSAERTATEVSWSHGVVVPVQVIAQAFGFVPKESAYGTQATNARSAPVGLIIALVILVLFLVFAAAACETCTGGSSGGGSSSGVRGIGGSSSGGFGGK
jgi:uncharacterized membrane protein YgcG